MSRLFRTARVKRVTDGLINLLRSKRIWPALPSSVATLESLNTAIIALRERSFVQSRERGDILSSFTTVQDMVDIKVVTLDGKTLAERVTAIEKRLDDAGIP